MSDTEDRDVLAAEFVLGSLDSDERAQAQTLMAIDQEFALTVAHWERRLGELHVMVEGVEPDPALWERIRGQIAPRPAEAAPAFVAANEPGTVPPPRAAGNVIDLTERFQRWRRIGIASGLVAASLAALIVLRDSAPEWLPPSLRMPGVETAASGGRFVAVLQRDEASPAFLMTVDLSSRTLTVRRVAAEQQPGKSYELWLVSNKFPAPRSLGVVGSQEFTVRQALAPYDPDTVREATYAISLEPEGGSPTGAATGPILFLGKLFEAAPAQTSGT